jgi:hypothetical protein
MLMAFVLVIGCGLGWMVHRAHVERDVIAAIVKVRGNVYYDVDWRFVSSSPPAIPWWSRWLADHTGLDFSGHVVSVNLSRVNLSRGKSDAVLAQVGRLNRIVNLNLNRSDVTDASLSHLKGLPSLRGLWLNNNRISDAGLVHLKGLTNLQALCLGYTGITDAGLAHLEGMTNLTELDLRSTKVTDAGLVHLRRMTKLKKLQLHGTGVTKAGVEELMKALPGRWRSPPPHRPGDRRHAER